MEDIYLVMPRWYLVMVMVNLFGAGIFVSILYFVFYLGKTVTKG